MRHVLTFLMVSLVAAAAVAGGFDFPVSEMDATLKCVFIDTSDITFRTDAVDLDSFRLDIIDALTVRPLAVPGFVKNSGDLLKDASRSVVELIDTALSWLDIHGAAPAGEPAPADYLSQLLEASASGSEGLRAVAEKVKGLVWRMDRAHSNTQQALTSMLTDGEIAYLRDTIQMFLLEEEEAVNLSVEEHDSLQKLHETFALRLKEIAPRIDLAPLLLAQVEVVGAFEELQEVLEMHRGELSQLPVEQVRSLLPPVNTPVGMIGFGSSADDRYRGDYALIVDLGGNDDYILAAPEASHQQVIIDLSGDDRYVAESDFTLGAALTGCGILADWRGDDIYRGGHFTLGCGLFGLGILIDKQGDDCYRGDICAQAAAGFGVGLLWDGDGHDRYDASLFSQGFGFIMGVGSLVDVNGNDDYRVGWKYGDVLRYENHYLSLSQGFGYGLRPHFSGGIGLLVDGAGHDSYNADIFGQGASYWFALGGLIDYAGTDRYIAHQYAQGSATHLCLAALIDVAGHDLYSSKGVSQGCGHDLAFGLLLDCGGDDQYHADDLSQAAGSANGIGIQIDLEGNDAYLVRAKHNTHGYGNPRRDYGSIGLFLDLGGSDVYSGYGADNSFWVTDSKWGIGADLQREGADDE